MKREYMKPEAEKIAFRYRDQVVAASGDAEENTVIPSNPSFGSFTNTPGSSGCKLHMFEAASWGFCDIL